MSKRNLCLYVCGAENVALARETFELCEPHLGARDPDTVKSLFTLGVLHLSNEDYELELLEKVMPLASDALGPKHEYTLSTLAYIGDAY